MAEFTLPKNSKIDKKAGKVFKAKEGASKCIRTFEIYRFDPEDAEKKKPSHRQVTKSTWMIVVRWF